MTARPSPLAVVAVGAASLAYLACATDRFGADDVGEDDEGPVVPEVFEATPALCSDGLDNDGDGAIDCCDIFCNEVLTGPDDVCIVDGDPEDTNERCSDCIDNDDNGFGDCSDFSCSRNPNVTVCESTDERCSDGIDNDGNGFTDCADRTCQNSDDVTVCPDEDTDALCSDGVDNDFNGFIDCDDFSCSRNDDVTVCE
ncbi:MAG: hypothetical protein AAF715_29890 [Myxococcota bacterium]